MTKKQIREYQTNLRDGLNPETRGSFNREIRQRLFDTEEYRTCTRVFTFISFRSEVDTYPIIEHSLKNGKKVYVPRVEQHGMEFYEITNLNGLIPSRYGVPEPPADEDKKYVMQKELIAAKPDNVTDSIKESLKEQSEPWVNIRSDNLMLLPGLAFDRFGNRIGYGAGFYDRYLVENPKEHFYKAALAYGFQVMDQIPADEYDIKADAIITPEEILRCRKI